jgi:glycerol-3-phosphate dehydrogenase
MAEDVINKAVISGGLAQRNCVTAHYKIHGWINSFNNYEPLSYYGADLEALQKLYEENSAWRELLHPDFPYTRACVIWAVRNEMALTIEDVFARRTRMLFLDARAAMQTAAQVALLMALEMQRDENWIQEQETEFNRVAKNYLL